MNSFKSRSFIAFAYTVNARVGNMRKQANLFCPEAKRDAKYKFGKVNFHSKNKEKFSFRTLKNENNETEEDSRCEFKSLRRILRQPGGVDVGDGTGRGRPRSCQDRTNYATHVKHDLAIFQGVAAFKLLFRSTIHELGFSSNSNKKSASGSSLSLRGTLVAWIVFVSAPRTLTAMESLHWARTLCPRGRKLLKPAMRSGWPLKRQVILATNPGMSMDCLWNAFMMPKKYLYTWGWLQNSDSTSFRYARASSIFFPWN